jgi:DNA-binding response OmpR family regulator
MEAENRKIVVVDDNPSNLRAGKNVLSEEYEVFTAPSAAKLFDLLADIKPALILLDIEMPEMDGYEAMRILKSREDTRDIPVIFLTGKTDSENEIEGLSLGAADYITKPFVPPLLLKRVETHLLAEEQKKLLEIQGREPRDGDILKAAADLAESRGVPFDPALAEIVISAVNAVRSNA